MGNTDRSEDGIDARREFVERLRTHETVRSVNFSRDGFRVVVVDLEPGAEFRERWRERAVELGYTVERPDEGESPLGQPADAWVLRLAGETSTDRSGWGTAVRDAAARVRTLVRRLLGR